MKRLVASSGLDERITDFFSNRLNATEEEMDEELKNLLNPGRRRRELVDSELGSMNETIYSNQTVAPYSTVNPATSSLAPAEERERLKRLVRDAQNITLTDLDHFTEYTIEVKACQEPIPSSTKKPCSVTAMTSVRTLPLAGADDIDESTISYLFDNSTIHSKLKLVHIRWSEPARPNGFILSYQIEYKRVTSEPVSGRPFLPEALSPLSSHRASPAYRPAFLASTTNRTATDTQWNCRPATTRSDCEPGRWPASATGHSRSTL